MTKDMTQGSPLKLLLAFAVPLMLGSLFQQFYNLADTIIVGSIPEYYTNVVTEDQNLVGDLNDYTPNFPDGE